MNYREMQFVAEGLQTPFWKYVQALGAETAKAKLEDGVSIIPATLGESNEREQLFGASKAITELLERIPSKIKDELKQLEEQESK